MKTTKKQQAIANEQANEQAQKTLQSAQKTDNNKSDKVQTQKTSVNVINEKALNKKSAINALDNEVRGFNANLKHLQKLVDEKNVFILQFFKDYFLNIENINYKFLVDNLPVTKIFANEQGTKLICKVTKNEKFAPIAVEKFIVNNTEYYKYIQTKFTCSEFLTMFATASRNQMKKAKEQFKEAKQVDSVCDKILSIFE